MNVDWLPGHREAAIAVSDDPDNSTPASFTAMYDLLAGIGFPTTRAMWVDEREEFTGTPPLPIEFTAPLLSDPDCLDTCRKLKALGFEICLHGASCGNNSRERTLRALDFLDREIGPSPVFIFHSKNAENLYWDARVANGALLQKLLGLYSKNRCFGEIPDSRYFWGDVCRERVRFVRLFRTRSLNTLAGNPSMPYHDFSKPFVGFWFSATKGHIPNLFSVERIDRLCRERGASVLYQYLHRYVDPEGRIPAEVRTSLTRVAEDGRVWKATVSALLERLKRFQLVFTRREAGGLYIINAGRAPLDDVQVRAEREAELRASVPFAYDRARRTMILPRIEPLSVVRVLEIGAPPAIPAVAERALLTIRRPLASVTANLSGEAVGPGAAGVREALPAWSVRVAYRDPEAERLEVLRPVPRKEIRKMAFAQARILLREHLFLGRKVSTRRYLRDPGRVESQKNW